jgi:hypothetical protein
MSDSTPGMLHSEERPREPDAPSGREAEEHKGPDEEQAKREKTMDKTLEDSYPASDPPSSIPDPLEDEDAA